MIGSLSSTIKLEAASKVLTGSNTSEKIGSAITGKECNYEQILRGEKICSEKINTLEAPIESRTSPPHKWRLFAKNKINMPKIIIGILNTCPYDWDINNPKCVSGSLKNSTKYLKVP